ncbi:MAG: TIGR01777 family protein [Bdellovibrionaceae bacterium]|nr:TIGR01777 family protein [Pseudobdellovibrionaceae bacterium]
MNILLTGATGLLGKKIGQLLVKNGHSVIAVSRNIEKAKLTAPFPATWIKGDLQDGPLALDTSHTIDGVIHLAGESVGEGSWSEAQKEKILKSRTQGTKHLLASINKNHLQFFVSASAIGYYGTSSDALSEAAPAGVGFLADVTKAWEEESSIANCRLCIFRIGVVLSTEGGALPKMLFPAQIFASSALGSGKQWLSWIHIDDVARAFVFAAENSKMDGTYNLVAPTAVQQKVFAKTLAKHMDAFNGPPVPSIALRLMLGEQASLVLNSLNVSSEKLSQTPFTFLFPDLNSALADLLMGWNNGAAVKKFEQYFDIPKEKIFPFFAEARNLEKITPEFLNFRIGKVSTETIQENTLIDYTLKVHGVPINWRTKIESWNPPNAFVDTQLKGPYSIWHHTHTFEDLGQGTLMKDIVRYKLPLGLPGRLVAQAFVEKDIESIFKYRREVVAKLL